MIVKRLLGIVILLTALSGVGVSAAIIILGQPVFDRVVNDLDDNFALLDSTMGTVSETLQLAQVTSSQVLTGLRTAEISLQDTATTMSQTRPLVTVGGDLVTHDIANSVESVQATIPTLAQLAGNVDKALTVLAQVNILGIGLGINYNPNTPLDQSIRAVGDSFNGIPEKLRNMAGPIAAADSNLGTMAMNLTEISANLHDITASFTQLSGLFTQYQKTVTTARQHLQATRAELDSDLAIIKKGLLIFCIWLGLTQLAPLYIGAQLLFGRG